MPDPHAGIPYIDEPDFSDMMFMPKQPPEPERELTTPERHDSGFQGEHYQGPQLGGFQEPGNEPVHPKADMDERRHKPLYRLQQQEYSVSDEPGGDLCVFSGWPRRHVRVGVHCPHGMRERLDRQKQGLPEQVREVD